MKQKGNGMDIQAVIDRLVKFGYILDVHTKEDGTVEASICHKSWITNNLYQARPLPTWKAATMFYLMPQIEAYLDEQVK